MGPAPRRHHPQPSTLITAEDAPDEHRRTILHRPSCGAVVAMLIDRPVVGEQRYGKEGDASGQKTLDEGRCTRSQGALEGQNARCKDRQGDEEN
jgi:hypothetical protein